MGGAVFVCGENISGLSQAGTLIIAGTVSFSGNSATPGTGVGGLNGGIGVGSDLFAMTGATIQLAPPLGATIVFNSNSISLADDSLASIPSGNTWVPGSADGAQLQIIGGAGTVNLGAINNQMSGGILLAEGTLIANSDSNLGAAVSTAGLTLDGGTFQFGSSFPFSSLRPIVVQSASTMDMNGFTSTIPTSVAGAGLLFVKSSLAGGVLNLDGTNSFNGLQIGAGVTAVVSADANTGRSTGPLILAVGTLKRVTNTVTLSNLHPFSLIGSGTLDSAGGVLNVNSGIIGSGALTIADSVGAGDIILTARAGYIGDTLLSGVLTSGMQNALPVDTTLTITSSGLWRLNGFASQVGALQGTGPVVLLSGETLTTGNNLSTAYSGTISGTGNLQVQGGVLHNLV
jgi:hypothetical protein